MVHTYQHQALNTSTIQKHRQTGKCSYIQCLMFNAHFRTFDDNLAEGTIKYGNQMGETFCNLQLLATILVFRFCINANHSQFKHRIESTKNVLFKRCLTKKITFAFDANLSFSLAFVFGSNSSCELGYYYYCRKNHLDNCITLPKHRFAQLHIHNWNNDCVQN